MVAQENLHRVHRAKGVINLVQFLLVQKNTTLPKFPILFYLAREIYIPVYSV